MRYYMIIYDIMIQDIPIYLLKDLLNFGLFFFFFSHFWMEKTHAV